MELSAKPPVLARTLVGLAVAATLVWYVARAISGVPDPPSAPLPVPALDSPLAPKPASEVAIFAGGCFWGTQAVFEHVIGVQKATAGYCGGHVDHPYYELVCSGSTGHAESVRVVYDPSQITYGQLLMVFFGVVHDPTQKNRQGPDVGTQYRSAIFFTSPEQQKIADAYIAQLNAAKIFKHPIATQLVSAPEFYDAEDYHQDYLIHHPDDGYIRAMDMPKLEHLKRDFPKLYH
ncbi:MAG TPA: peptide-methionine (S)-S-oxide reductase MsrA [Candidatus Acidoferrum sp.]|nr:peptide-methionine (S)-S-oxide reductase MsrA [Candidatus Acidoferrum sp.]